jgi:hypothetical protein
LIDGNGTAFKFLDIENKNLLDKNLKVLCADDDSVAVIDKIVKQKEFNPKADMISLVLQDNNKHVLKIKSAELTENNNGNLLLFLTDLTEINKTKQITETLFRISREANLCRNLDVLYAKIHDNLKEITNATNFAVG